MYKRIFHIVSISQFAGHSSLTHWGRDNMADVYQTTFSMHFLMKLLQFWLKFHWKFWFRQWLGAGQPTGRCLNQRWPSILTQKCFTRPQRVKVLVHGGWDILAGYEQTTHTHIYIYKYIYAHVIHTCITYTHIHIRLYTYMYIYYFCIH